MKYSKTVFFYLNEDETAELTVFAKKKNLSRSKYARQQIDKCKMKPTLNIDYRQFTSELTPLLEKVNLVIDRAWHTKMLDVPMLREVLKSVDMILTEIMKAKETAQCEQEKIESQLE